MAPASGFTTLNAISVSLRSVSASSLRVCCSRLRVLRAVQRFGVGPCAAVRSDLIVFHALRVGDEGGVEHVRVLTLLDRLVALLQQSFHPLAGLSIGIFVEALRRSARGAAHARASGRDGARSRRGAEHGTSLRSSWAVLRRSAFRRCIGPGSGPGTARPDSVDPCCPPTTVMGIGWRAVARQWRANAVGSASTCAIRNRRRSRKACKSIRRTTRRSARRPSDDGPLEGMPVNSDALLRRLRPARAVSCRRRRDRCPSRRRRPGRRRPDGGRRGRRGTSAGCSGRRDLR